MKTETGEIKSIKFSICIVAAGAHSREIANMARIGSGAGTLQLPLPVEPR